jgi:hypothetical protein
MLAAVLVLALGGGFGQVGVLGQIFAGPPAPSVSGGGVAGPASGSVARSLPVIPVSAAFAPGRGGGGTRAVGGRRGMAPVHTRGPSQTGGALGVGSVAPIVSAGTTAPTSSPVRSAPAGSTRSQPSPQPGPSPSPKPQPTPVDRIVNTVTPVTQQLPAPVGPAATQVVESAGSAADSLLPKLP